MIIERAVKGDREEILELQKLAYRSEGELYNDFNIKPLTQTLEDISAEFGTHSILKAVFDGTIKGSVRAYENEGTCYIGKLIVHPDMQNRGIGTALMKEIEKMFAKCKRFELFTGYKSEKNLYLYRKLGFKEFKTEKITENLSLIYLEKAEQ